MIVDLEPQHWQTVLNILADAPFRVVAPVISMIQGQLNNQPQQPEDIRVPNGSDKPAMTTGP